MQYILTADLTSLVPEKDLQQGIKLTEKITEEETIYVTNLQAGEAPPSER